MIGGVASSAFLRWDRPLTLGSFKAVKLHQLLCVATLCLKKVVITGKHLPEAPVKGSPERHSSQIPLQKNKSASEAEELFTRLLL